VPVDNDISDDEDAGSARSDIWANLDLSLMSLYIVGFPGIRHEA
jgi:hypothetical protein